MTTTDQELVFEEYWSRFSEEIRYGRGKVDFDLRSAKAFRTVTVICRLPAGVMTRCGEVADALRQANPSMFVYPRSSLHFTLINLDSVLGHSGVFRQESTEFQKILDNVEHRVKKLGGLRVNIRGIGLFPTTIFAQVFDINGNIDEYRSVVQEAVHEVADSPGPVADAVVNGVAFVNLARFLSVPNTNLVDVVNQLRDVELGSFDVERVEVVTTDKVMSEVNTTIHRSIILRTR